MVDRLRIDGTEAGERLVGTFGNDHIEGFGGNDLIVERAGDNLLNGGTGDDRILGGVNTDTMDGGAGNDLVNGGLGNDIAIFVVGESNGDDLYSGGDDTDTLRVQVTALQLTDSTIVQALKDLQSFVQETATAGGDTREIHRSDVLGLSVADFEQIEFVDETGVVIYLPEPNVDPVAADDSGVGFTTDEDTSFRTASVLTNDSDADGGALSIVSIDTAGTLGLVTDNGDGTFNYNPNGQFESLAAGESTTDSFTYTLSDGQGGSSTATVTITIDGRDEPNIPPIAADDSGEGFATDEDTAFRTASVLTNDSDADGGTLSIVSIDTTGTLGQVTDNGDGTFNYNPNGQFESLTAGESTTDSFTYTLSDGQGGSNTATVTIAIDGRDEPNIPPVAADDSGEGFATDEDTAFRTASVLTNDSDADGGTLSIVSIDTTGTLGQVTDNGDGTFNYNPNGQFKSLAAGESTTDSFTYTLSDGQGGSSTATVTIAIDGRDEPNIPPVAVDDNGEGFATDEDTAFRIASVLTNDSDADGGTLSIVSIDTTGTLGLVTDNGDGTFNYNPNGQFESLAAGESTIDSFTYTLSDGQGGSSTATVTIAIEGRDEPDLENPTIFAALSNDTGGSAQDNITTDPTIAGSTTDNSAVTGLFARLSTAVISDFVDIPIAHEILALRCYR